MIRTHEKAIERAAVSGIGKVLAQAYFIPFDPEVHLIGWENRKGNWCLDTHYEEDGKIRTWLTDWRLDHPKLSDGETVNETVWHLTHRNRVAIRLQISNLLEWVNIAHCAGIPYTPTMLTLIEKSTAHA